MRYIDSATRDASEVLGEWLASFNSSTVSALRLQTGYFSSDGLAPLLNVIEELKTKDCLTNCVIGSNGGETGQLDIEILLHHVGSPRDNARIGVVSYSSGLFHPKVYHFTRFDGSQAAYVGSANLTSPGISGMNIEAGLLLDTSFGDANHVLADIASSIDAWFDGTRQGFSVIACTTDLPHLIGLGILGQAPTPRPATSNSTSGSGVSGKVGLKPIINFPSVSSKNATSTAASPVNVTPSTLAISKPASKISPVPPSSPRPHFPQYMLFAPGITSPTQGADALTGANLAGGTKGLIIRLSLDSARHFSGNNGTANVSVPVATIGAIRFGIFPGKYQRPRAEFELRMRYISIKGVYEPPISNTNIMAYGYSQGESGHKDLRMIIPAAPAREIRKHALSYRLHIPANNDPMILEWPTLTDPCFKATFVDQNTPLYGTLEAALDSAITSSSQVGQGACWLPPSISPQW